MTNGKAPSPPNTKHVQQRALLDACADVTAAYRMYHRAQQALDREREADDNSAAFWKAQRRFTLALREWSDAITEVRRAARVYTRYTRTPPSRPAAP